MRNGRQSANRANDEDARGRALTAHSEGGFAYGVPFIRTPIDVGNPTGTGLKVTLEPPRLEDASPFESSPSRRKCADKGRDQIVERGTAPAGQFPGRSRAPTSWR